MRVMVLVKATQSSEAGEMPSPELMQAMHEFNQQLLKAGILEAGEGLKPSDQGKRVHFSGNKREVIDGPFTQTEELVAGFWIWRVGSMEEALEWVKRCPNPMPQESDIEIRPFYEMEDFAEVDASGEIARQEQVMRNRLSARKTQMTPYLFFNGQSEAALNFYQQALGAEIISMMRFSESPEPMPEGAVPEGYDNKIMHAEFKIGDNILFASDGCGPDETSSGFRLNLTVSSQAEAERMFAALSEGGSVDMPLGPTFWAPCFGMVTDKFNLGWMLMVAPAEEEHG